MMLLVLFPFSKTHQMKKTFLSTLLFCFAAVSTLAQRNIVDEVIWVVGDNAILLSDVEETRISAEMDNNPFARPYCEIPEQLALQQLYLHQADLDSITVSEGDIIRAVDERLNFYLQNFGSRENIEAQARKPYALLREQLKQTMRDNQRVQMVQRNLTKNIKVTPAEVREYFKNVPEDSLPFIPTQVEVQILTYQPEVSRQEVERIEERLREYARRVNDGESEFSTLARLYSQCGSARQGGDLGYNGRNQWVPEFANVAFSLNDPKKVSKIVRSEFGFHIIQFVDRKGDKVRVRHILLKPEIEESEFALGISRLDSVAADIRAGKFTFDEAVLALSDDKYTRNNHGLMVNTSEEDGSITSRFQMKDLPQDVARVVEGMQVGEVSKPFRMINEKGQEYCAIIRLKNRIPGHRAGITEDFQVLREVVLNERRERCLQNWIREKQKSTYVRINPDWRNCDFKYPGWVK